MIWLFPQSRWGGNLTWPSDKALDPHSYVPSETHKLWYSHKHKTFNLTVLTSQLFMIIKRLKASHNITPFISEQRHGQGSVSQTRIGHRQNSRIKCVHNILCCVVDTLKVHVLWKKNFLVMLYQQKKWKVMRSVN